MIREAIQLAKILRNPDARMYYREVQRCERLLHREMWSPILKRDELNEHISELWGEILHIIGG